MAAIRSCNAKDGEAVKNLSYFLGCVMTSAQREGEWCKDGIERGLGWAFYCEKAAWDPSLRNAVVTYLDSKPFGELYSINDIQCSRALFISVLFINQLISEEVSQDLKEISLRELGSSYTLSLLRVSVDRMKHYQKIVEILRSKSFGTILNNFKVRLLIESVSTLGIPLEAFNRLLKSNGSLALLLDLTQSLSQQDKNKFLSCFGCWMYQELEKDDHTLFNQISNLSFNQIDYICSIFPGLHTKLLNCVYLFGTHLCSMDVDDLGKNYLFKSLMSLCHSFFLSSNLCSATKVAFSVWLVSEEAYFWHNLFVQIQILLNCGESD